MSEHIYQPQKLLLSNLFLCLNIEIEDFSTDIYNQIINDINSNVEVIKEYINRNAEKNKSIIPYSLVREIDKKLQKCSSLLKKQKNNEQVKLPDYCLFGIYKLLQGLINSIEKNSFQKYSYVPNYKGDMDVIEKYMKCFSGYLNLEAEAVSLKNLRAILNPNKVPYNDKKIELVEYILKNVIPKLLLKYENNCFFSYINNNKWERFIFYDLNSPEKVLFYEDDYQELIGALNGYFDDIQKNKSNFDKVGEILLNIFHYICDLCNDNKLSLNSQKSNSENAYNEERELHNEKSINYYYDGILSTNILYFIQWFPMIDSDFSEEKRFNLIDNVISSIRDDMIKYFKENNDDVIINPNSTCIFLGDNIDLRHMLIRALLNETEIRSYFLKSYNIKIDNGGNNE